ncbi:MAG: peptide chain release factor N(5)-glutamine methyltransferase [Elusimicrobiaceae bacterium]|nr:peptide chain release factor N(5)-glutamine methyltransferase [Elusimicrobiaceae bacterium]
MGIFISGMYRTAGELLKQAQKTLETARVGEPLENAELLLAYALGKSRLTLRAFPDFPVGENQRLDFSALLERKAAGEPLAYITGRAAFLEYEFIVSPAVLVPRPETEQLARFALDWLNGRAGACDVLDLGAGSGCIACALALRAKARVTASDISPDALAVAKTNAEALGAAVRFVRSDLFAGITGKFDLIVSNPPYIPSEELAGLAPEVRREPACALDGGPDGLELLRRIIGEAPAHLNPGGVLMLETGSGQRAAIKTMFSAGVWRGLEFLDDFSGFDRYFIARV